MLITNLDSRASENKKINDILQIGEKRVALDTLSPKVSRYANKLDSLSTSLTYHIDSLQKLNLPTFQYTHLLDSLQSSGPLKDIRQAEARIAALEKKVNSKVANFNSTLTNTGKNVNDGIQSIDKMGASVDQVKIPQIGSIPPAGLPNTSFNLPSTANSNPFGSSPIDTNLKLPGEINTNPTDQVKQELNEIKSNSDVANLQKELSEAQGYSKDARAIANGDLDSVRHLTGAIENKAAELANVGELKGNTEMLDQYKTMADQAKDPEAMRKFAVEEARKQAVNHFAGQEQVIQTAMNQISKLKQKLPSLSSFSDLPKRIPNPLHGKPFTDRLVPGLTLLVQSKQHFTIDFNPSLGYRFNGRLTGGLGWNERIGFQRQHQFGMHALNRGVYGPRSYATFAMGRGFSFMGSVEAMNTYVPRLSVTGPSDKGSRQWVWGVFIGFRKDYKFFGGIKGNWQTLYNLAAINNNESPYVDRLQVRMGFELPIKKDEDKVGRRPAWRSYIPLTRTIPNLRQGQLQDLNIGQNKYDVNLLRQEYSRDTLLISRGFSHYRKSKRMVIEGKSKYYFSYDRKAKADVIRNEQGTILATTERFNHITLADGRSLELVQLYPNQWKCVSEGKELMQATRTGNGAKSNLEFIWDESVQGKDKELLEMICKVRAGLRGR